MYRCRVYLFTYNRNELLIRAIESLRKQTYDNWVCELHNDMPGNSFPEDYIATLNDPRFIIRNHEENLGPVNSFNLAFDKCDEEFISILEDDNWWEPPFLKTMISHMDNYKNVKVAWANMNIWQEGPNNGWTFLNKTIWPVTAEKTSLIDFPQYKQSFSALHSNGAMLVRNINIAALKTPLNIRFDFIEQIRERSFPHPILFINAPMANFALTLSTSRPQNKIEINEYYFLLLTSFFRYLKKDEQTNIDIWNTIKNNKVKSFHNLIYAGLLDKNCRCLLKYSGIADWIFFLVYNIKHPSIFFRCLFSKRNHIDLWEYLDTNTKERFNEINY